MGSSRKRLSWCRASGALNHIHANPRLAPWAKLWSRLRRLDRQASYNTFYMFERYAAPARRAVFFASRRALFSEAPEITSVDLLASLLLEDNSRAQTLFHLRDYFPLYTGCPRKVTTLPKEKDGPPLDDDSKKALAWAAIEATKHLWDYWIDTEHLLLGLLRTQGCPAWSYLTMTGLTLRGARKTIRDNKHTRPNYGHVPRLWWFTSPF